MATKVGTVSQNKSKYKFYIDYSTSFSTSSMKWTVTANVYLQVSYYAYEGRTTHKLSIGGTVKSSKSNYTKACYSNSGTKSFLIASGTQTYAASASSRSVTISASMSAPSGGYGPGTCSASVTVTLGAKLSSAGRWGTATSTINSLTYSVTGLSTSLGYTRKVYFDVGPYGGSYTKTQSKSVGASTSSVSFTTTGLMPGTRYQTRARVYAPNNALMLTLGGNIYTKSETMTLSVSSVGANGADVWFTLGTKNIGYERYVYWYKRLKGASSWESVSGTVFVPDGSNSGANLFRNLIDDSDYEVLAICKIGDTEICRATTSFHTIKGLPDHQITEQGYADGKLTIEVIDSISTLPVNNQVVVYVYTGEDSYFVGEQVVQFTEEVMPVKFPITDSEVQTALSNEHTLLCLLCEDGSSKIKYIAHTQGGN